MAKNQQVTPLQEVIYNYYWRAPAGTPLAAWLLEQMRDKKPNED